jgi:cation diffusion facilitator family transporter
MQQPPLRRGLKATLIGISANGALALAKGIAGYLGNSYALIADAIESASDVLSSCIVYLGLRFAARPPDENHPYGHGKAEPLAALTVSLALLGAATAIGIESTREIVTPHHAPAPFTLVVLVLVVVVKETLFRIVFRVGQEVDSTALKTDAWHHRSDAITSATAFVGISVALIGGRGYESADDWAALAASAIITYNAARLLRSALYELSDASPSGEVERHIRDVAGSVPAVMALDKCLVRKMGLDYIVDLDVIVDGGISVRDGHRIAHDVQSVLRRTIPRISRVYVHVEPHDRSAAGETRRLNTPSS